MFINRIFSLIATSSFRMICLLSGQFMNCPDIINNFNNSMLGETLIPFSSYQEQLEMIDIFIKIDNKIQSESPFVKGDLKRIP